MKKILIVEDNNEYRNLLARELDKAGYDVDEAISPIKGLEKVALKKYDVVISDLNLPVMSGVTFMESVKNISERTACVILTGDPDNNSELLSIQNNIDLYIEKNKSISVLLGYIERLIKQQTEVHNQDVVLTSENSNIILCVNEHIVTKDGEAIDLTPKEFEILKIFLANKNKVLSREELVKLAWAEPEEDIDIRLVDSHIKKIRDKIKAVSIMTVRGYGYRWNEVD